MIKNVILVVGMFFTHYSFAQQLMFVKKWDKRFGGISDDHFTTLHQTHDLGYILGGVSKSDSSNEKSQDSQGSYDYWIVKIDSIGNKQWDKRFGGVNSDVFSFFNQTYDGGYIIGGSSSSGISGDKTQNTRGGSDFWIVKIDSVGNKEWDKTFGGDLSDLLWGLTQTSDKGYIFGGPSNSGLGGDKTQENWDSTHLNDDFWVVKVDSLGTKEWDRRFGGTGHDMLIAITQSDNGEYLLAGSSSSDSTGDKSQSSWEGSTDFWVIKIDSMGNKLWDKRYGGASNDYISSLITTHDKGYVLGGYSNSGMSGDKTQSSIGAPDYWMVKTDSLGNKQWDKRFGGFGANYLNQLSQTLDGGYLLSGRSSASVSGDKSEINLEGGFKVWLIKTDSFGNKQWDKTIQTTGYDSGMGIQVNDECFIVGLSTHAGIGGYITDPNRDGIDSTNDYWVMKFCWEPVGINDGNDNSNFLVYPNPFTTDISIALQKENLKEATFTITNLQGQVVFNRQETNLAPSYTKMLDLSYLPNGVYLVEVIIDGERTVKKIIKE